MPLQQLIQVLRHRSASFFVKGYAMNKTTLTALGAALLILGASAPALAECDSSLLPNQKNWSYQLTQTSQVGSLYQNQGGEKDRNDNWFVDVTTVTLCGTINNGGNLVDDHSYVLDSGDSERVLVCQQNNGLTSVGAALGFTAADCAAVL